MQEDKQLCGLVSSSIGKNVRHGCSMIGFSFNTNMCGMLPEI